MNGADSVSIVGFAGCTSLGYSLGPTLAAMGAGLSNFTDSGIRTPFDTPAMAASLFDRELPRAARLAALAGIAIADLRSFLDAAGGEPPPLLLGLPAGLEEDELKALLAAVDRNGSTAGTTARFPYGRASTFAALASASDLIARGEHRRIVVGGIDSLCSRQDVHRLVQLGRVLGAHTEGTIPGEAAVFALLARSDDTAAVEPTAVGLEAVALHRAVMPFGERDRVLGDDLAVVFRALRQRGCQRVERVTAAHSGEGYFGRSFSHAYLREIDIMPEPLEVDLIADCAGDVGAAAGLLGLAFATYRMVTEPRSGRGRALVYSESDTGELGAAIIAGAPTAWARELVA
jgi:3-oxoacyl-[acyl-carrier-protein] synthase-1